MRILLTIVLLMAVAAPASGLDRKPRKKEKKIARTEAVAEPALLRPQSPHTPSAKPNLPRRHPHRSRITT